MPVAILYPEYAYIYNKNTQIVALEEDIVFGTNGIIVGSITKRQIPPQYRLAVLATMRYGFIQKLQNQINSLFSKMAELMTAPYMAQGAELKGIRGW